MRLSLTLASLLAFASLAEANHRSGAGGCAGSQGSGCVGAVGGCSGSQGSGGLLHRNGSILGRFHGRQHAQAPASTVTVQSTTTIRAAAPLPTGPANCPCGAMGCPATPKK